MDRPMRAWVLIASLVLGVISVAGCGKAEPGAGPQPVLRLGALLPISGPNNPAGRVMKIAAEMAIKAANEAGGVIGHQVELILGDDACDAATAVSAANDIVTKDITVSVGGLCSNAVVPTLKIFHDAGVPMLIPAANSTDLISPGYDNVFLMSGTTKAEGSLAMEWLYEMGGRSVALVHDGTSFPSSLAAGAAEGARAGGRMAVATELKLSQGSPNYARTAEAVRASKADTVYFTGYSTEAGKLVADLRTGGYTGLIMVGDATATNTFFKMIDAKTAEGVYGTALPHPQFLPGAVEWSAKFRAIAGSDPSGVPMLTYDAVTAALDAVRRAGSTDRKAVRKALAETKDLKLLSGSCRWAADGSRVDPPFHLVRANEGKFTLVKSSATAGG